MIVVLLAVAAQAAAQVAAQPAPAAPFTPTQTGAPHRGPRRQIFVAPSGEPFRAAPDAPYPVADWFARADTPHDGKLTEAAFTADFVRFADALDLNHDGVIDSAEVQAYETNVLPELHEPAFGGRGRPDGGDHPGGENGARREGGGDRPTGAGRFELLPLPEPVAAMDTAADGRITRAEVLAAAHARFAQLDTARRGYLKLGDLPETWLQTRRRLFQQHGGGGGGGRGWGWGGGRGGMGSGDMVGGPGNDGSGGGGGGAGNGDQGN